MDIKEQKRHLMRQLDFIRRSCESYDAGFEDEAVRIAQTIRVLLHDTRSSTSLLALMGKKDHMELLTTCRNAPVPGGLLIMDSVSMFTMEGIKPCLSETGFAKEIPVAEWWAQVVLVTGPEQKHSRKSIILATANKDGGAHVDENITPDFRTQKEGYWTFDHGNSTEELADYHFIAIRQFGYEIMNSRQLSALAG